MEKYSFFNSVNGDRKYDVDDWSKWFIDFFTNGIFNNGLQVKAGNGMQIIISPGVAFAQGHKYYNDSDFSHTITIADSDQDRIDNVVLRVDETNRTFTSQIIEGSYAKTPVAPNLVRNTTTYDLRLATISIPAGTTEITSDMITDCRFNSSDCGSVIQAVQNPDFTKVVEECYKQVEEVVENAKEILSENVAGELLNKINENSENEWEVVDIPDEELDEWTVVE